MDITQSAPVHLVDEAPVSITNVSPHMILVDFGRVAFGNVRLVPPTEAAGKIVVQFGECLVNGRINRHPPGSVRYARVETVLRGSKPLIVAPPADARNTAQPMAVLTPPEWGVILPFRWVELQGWPGEIRPGQIVRRAAFASDWDDGAASFHCSDERLDRIWELCRYSIKATTFAGVYVDGDRERTAYEADAYLSQISRYYTDGDVQMARDTFDRLLSHPTWPTEWAPQMIFMADADWMQTGETNWLAAHYASLKTKLQLDQEGPDGLLVSGESQIKRDDLVDWPARERDGYVFTRVNTVVNAFHLRALTLMARLAGVLGQDTDAKAYAAGEAAAQASFQKKLFDATRGLYRDGEGTEHISLHANLFPLAFGLVPGDRAAHVAHWLAKRGMRCSVYAAQYLMAGLFEQGEATRAIELMTAPGDRSWEHMLDSDATITWEAWDQRFKPNLDWNHAWGAAPANLLPRYVLGVQPLAAGWNRVLIAPNPGPLKWAEGKVPSPLGPVQVRWTSATTFRLSLGLPLGMTAQVRIPILANAKAILVNGQTVKIQRDGQRWTLEQEVAGTNVIEAR